MHPVAADLEYQVERNRLTVFFRYLVALPWLVWSLFYGVAAIVAEFIAWFVLMFTKRYPDSLYRFVAGYIEVATKIQAFASVATDAWPPFTPGEDSYPMHVRVGPQQAEYRRSRTFFKALLAFPQVVILFGLGLALSWASFISWWRIMITGRQSATMHDVMRAILVYGARSSAFTAYLTEVHPRLLDLPPQEIPADAPAMPGQQQLPVHAKFRAGTPALPSADPYGQGSPPPPPPPPPSV